MTSCQSVTGLETMIAHRLHADELQRSVVLRYGQRGDPDVVPQMRCTLTSGLKNSTPGGPALDVIVVGWVVFICLTGVRFAVAVLRVILVCRRAEVLRC